MLALVERMLKGDTKVVDDFQKAVGFWREFFAKNRDLNDKDLATEIGHAQTGFEILLGWDRYFAKSIMPTAMMAALYDTDSGFEDNEKLARRALRATEQSKVSLEVKGTALKVAALAYHLSDELE
jgi:hypothetical protein